jgi:uncharacterized membrane protein YeaQ/YmgE (transglycosylase-associated protein family)
MPYSTVTDLLVVMCVGLFLGGAVLSHIGCSKRGKQLMIAPFVVGAIVLVIRSQTGD